MSESLLPCQQMEPLKFYLGYLVGYYNQPARGRSVPARHLQRALKVRSYEELREALKAIEEEQ